MYVVVVAAGSPFEEMGLGHPAGATVGAIAGATAGLVVDFGSLLELREISILFKVVKFDWILIVNPRRLLLLFIYLIILV